MGASTMTGTETKGRNRRFAGLGRLAWGMVLLGLVGFVAALLLGEAQTAWRAYLVNFLLFSAIAQGGLAVSAMANTVHVYRSSFPQLAESFSAFFPVSLLLFLGLIPGAEYIFPWLGQDFAAGKDLWLSLPFLFTRDAVAFVLLYALGLMYLYYSLWLRVGESAPQTAFRARLARIWSSRSPDPETFAHRRFVLGILYLIAFAAVLSLVGFDLVMAAEPHWYSTLFGAYSFIKALFVGIGALIILAAALHMGRSVSMEIASWEYIDIGKLLLAFCLLWADFFYCQLVVIWYGNIPEETAYVITRTIQAPWNVMAGTVFALGFVVPFLVLINRRVKTLPALMTGLCCAIIAGMWLEHYLLLAPALGGAESTVLPLSWADPVISLAFLGIMIRVVLGYLNQFPEALEPVAGSRLQGAEGK
jgi:hypothetical protein